MAKEQNYSIEPESVNWKLPYMLKCNEYSNKKILVLHSYECAYMASINNSVIYVTDDEKKFKLFKKKVVNSIHFGSDDNAYLIKTSQWKDFKKVLDYICKEENMPKFDVCIMNPPYEKNLHLKILECVIPNANQVVNISPIGKMQQALLFDTKLPIDNMAIDKIPMQEAVKIFPIELREDLGIWTNGQINTNIVPEYNLCRKIVKKFQTFSNKISNKFEKTIGQYPVKFVYGATIAGNGGKGKACYRIISTNDNTAFSTIPTGHVKYVNVNSNSEQKELQKVYNLVFLRFCYLMIEHGNTPYSWLPIFDNTWDNKRFCEYFGITGYISDTEAKKGSEWETILNTMKEYE